MQPHTRSFTARIASFSFKRKWYVLAAWVLLLVGSGVASSGLSKVLTTEAKDLSNSDSRQAYDLVQDRFGERPFQETITLRNESLTVDDPAFVSAANAFTARLAAIEGVARLVTFAQAGDPSMVSADRHDGIISLTLAGTRKQAEEKVQGVLDAVASPELPAGFETHVTGQASLNYTFSKVSEDDIKVAETFGLPVALIVMVVAFGAVVAAGVPLILAFFAILPALGTVTLIGHAMELSFFVTNIITMIGLAVGIDYSMFMIGRYREELEKGRDRPTALAIAADSSGRAVFFSGITVLLALGGMLLVRSNIFVSIGVGAMVVVLYAVLASLTLLPALLGILGGKIDALRVPLLGKAHAGTRFWTAVTHQVQRRPVLFVVASAGLLLAAATPLVTIELGSNGIESLPHDTEAYRALTALQNDFAAGRISPVQVVVDAPSTSDGVQQGVARLQGEVAARPDLQFLGVTSDTAGTTTLIELATSKTGTGPEEQALVRDLRTNLLPAAFGSTGAAYHLGGELPATLDVKAEMNSKVVVVFGFVLGLSFLLLLMVFRSVAIPAKAIVMNLLSVGAAYGLVVLVFQHGFLAKQLGFIQTDQIEFWLPLFLFSILFGLSMDYHVFLLSRVKEEYGRTGDNKLAVANGVTHTAGMITSAAIIMVSVFAAFAAGSLVSLQQMGFGLAVAVFLDATVIRSVLVPASMQLLGKYNWWMPSWLGWLPTLNVEGGSRDFSPAAGD